VRFFPYLSLKSYRRRMGGLKIDSLWLKIDLPTNDIAVVFTLTLSYHEQNNFSQK
jgi:hypothetical protein